MKSEILILLAVALVYGYIPPIGIPDPGFGIDQSVSDYYGGTYDGGAYSDDNTDSIYTHYVNKDAPGATDTDNPRGTRTTPRLTFPDSSDVKPGAIVYVRAGNYATTDWECNWAGSAAAPIYFRFHDTTSTIVHANGEFNFHAKYIIVENLYVRGQQTSPDTNICQLQIYPTATPNLNTKRVVLRHCRIVGTVSVMGLSGSNYTDSIVVYKCNIRANFVCNGVERTSSNETSGLDCGSYLHNIWALENHIHNYPEDPLGGFHEANFTSWNIYYGKNLLDSCGSNAVDIKAAYDVVISQNTIRHFHGENYDTDAPAIVIHGGYNIGPRNCWIMFNYISDIWADRAGDVAAGVQISGDQEQDVFIIGNVFENIKNVDHAGTGIVSWSHPHKLRVLNNTFYDCDVFINRDENDDTITLKNNIFMRSYTGTGLVLDAPMDSSNNRRASTSDNIFTDTASGDFTLVEGSYPVNNGILSPIYATYDDSIGAGLSILYDIRGYARPVGDWDIGAYEYGATGPSTKKYGRVGVKY